MFLLFLFISIFYISCSDDDNGTVSSNSPFVGTWEAISYSADITERTNIDGIENIIQTNYEGHNFNYELVLGLLSFSTSGTYDLEYTSTSDGILVSDGNIIYTFTGQAGDFTSNDSSIMLEESLYLMTRGGIRVAGSREDQTFAFELINGNELILTQNEMITSFKNGIATLSTFVTNSVWRKVE